MKNLAKYQDEHDGFFQQLRFELWEEPTTDSVRKVRWLYRFPAFELPDNNDRGEPTTQFLLVLSVDYELFIGDASDVPSSANSDYCFEGVRLELRDARSDQPLGTLPLKITTGGELKAFLSKFSSRPNTSRHFLPR